MSEAPKKHAHLWRFDRDQVDCEICGFVPPKGGPLPDDGCKPLSDPAATKPTGRMGSVDPMPLAEELLLLASDYWSLQEFPAELPATGRNAVSAIATMGSLAMVAAYLCQCHADPEAGRAMFVNVFRHFARGDTAKGWGDGVKAKWETEKAAPGGEPTTKH